MENNWKAREQGRMDNGTYKPVSLVGDDPNRFLHVSLLNPDMVAYTKDDEKGRADIQTKTTLEMYIRKFGLETTGRYPGELEKALEGAIAIILGEYPTEDERYQFAMDAARRFNINTEEM